jgi:hypothetical protein
VWETEGGRDDHEGERDRPRSRSRGDMGDGEFGRLEGRDSASMSSRVGEKGALRAKTLSTRAQMSL